MISIHGIFGYIMPKMIFISIKIEREFSVVLNNANRERCAQRMCSLLNLQIIKINVSCPQIKIHEKEIKFNDTQARNQTIKITICLIERGIISILLSPAFSKKSGGTWFLAFRNSVRPSVRPSFRPSVPL